MGMTRKQRAYAILSKSDKADGAGVVFDVALYSSIGLVLVLTWLNTLSGMSSSEAFHRFHHAAIIVVNALFIAEFLLRLWSCTANGEFSDPLTGRIRFAFLPFQLIDALAIGSVLLLGVNANLLFLRAIRLFSVSEYMGESGTYSPAQIMKRSVLNKKEELVITVFIAGTIIILCAYAIFYVEKDFQPERITSLTPSLAWAFGVLTGTLQADFDPVTGVGGVLYVAMKLMGVVIVGLPVGIITGGFVQEIPSAKAFEDARKKAAVIRHAFGIEDKIPTRTLLKELGIEANRRLLDMDVAMARLQFSSEDIFSAVASDPGLRVMAAKQSQDSCYEDNLQIEEFTANTPFGGFISRPGRFHVVCTQSAGDAVIGHFSRTLSNVIGASYYSNEYFSSGELLPERQFNFAVNPLYLPDGVGPIVPAFDEWRRTLEAGIAPGDQVLYIGTASADREADLHMLFGGRKGEGFDEVENPTMDDRAVLKRYYDSLSESLAGMELKVITHGDFANINPKHVSLFMRRELKANVVSLFVSVKILQYRSPATYYNVIKAIADLSVETLVPKGG